jgi:hypothetical protein
LKARWSISMATEHQPRKHGPEGYEQKDADVRNVARYGLALAITLVIVMVAMDWTFKFFAKIETLGPPASPFENVRVLPPQPRLQPQPISELKSYCQAEQLELTSYGWVDQHNGVVRIPVDRAMDLVLQRGLPARPANQASSDSSTAMPAGSPNVAPSVMGAAGPCGYLVTPVSESSGTK